MTAPIKKLYAVTGIYNSKFRGKVTQQTMYYDTKANAQRAAKEWRKRSYVASVKVRRKKL